jgi:mycoredoxin
MYTTSRCGYCVLLKRYLDFRGIVYQEVNIEDDPALQRQLEEWTGGYRTVPTVQIGEQVLVNPRGPEVEAALATQYAAAKCGR